MRIRRAIAGFALCLASGAAAAAQDSRQVEVGYEITYAGMAGFRIDVTARFNGGNYDVETNTFKNGILRAVTINYSGRNRSWAAQYGAGGALSEKHMPEWKPAPHQAIPEQDRVGSLDPLSAALMAGFA